MTALMRSSEHISFYGCRDITPLEEKAGALVARDKMLKEAVRSVSIDLMKEAAFIQDPESVDVLLSLGFINEDNILEFVRKIPEMESVLQSLCDLLFASRIGLSQHVPPEVVEKAVRGLTQTIDKLERLKYISAE